MAEKDKVMVEKPKKFLMAFRRVAGWLVGAAVFAGFLVGLLGLVASWVIILRSALR